jgi:hypothetical protein
LFADLNGFPPMLLVWPHMIHAWMMWNERLEDGRRTLEEMGSG